MASLGLMAWQLSVETQLAVWNHSGLKKGLGSHSFYVPWIMSLVGRSAQNGMQRLVAGTAQSPGALDLWAETKDLHRGGEGVQ